MGKCQRILYTRWENIFNWVGGLVTNWECGMDGERFPKIDLLKDIFMFCRQQASELVFRGRKLVLNYTDGSPCPAPRSSNFSSLEIIDDDTPKKDKEHDQDDKDKDKDKETGDRDKNDGKKDGNSDHEPADSSRRKSTLMSFLCDRDLVSPAASMSFVGTLDSCTYFFEVRSAAACGGVARTEGGLGPAGVFGVMYVYPPFARTRIIRE